MKLVTSLVLLTTLTIIDLQQNQGAKAERNCSKNCKPFIQETIHCNQDTGECSEGCYTGYYGLTCDKACQCGGGACDFRDGICKDNPNVKPSIGYQVFPSSTVEGNTAVLPVVVSCLCLLVVILTLFIIFLICCGKGKILRKFQGNVQLRYRHEEGEALMPNGYLNEPLTGCQRKLLVNELGVHFLTPDDKSKEPVILFCLHMKFDSSRVNTRKTRLTKQRFLANELPETPSDEPNGFKKFSGTTTLSPTFHGDCPTYWEVHTNVEMYRKLQPTSLLLCIGLCRESDRDVDFQIPPRPHCYNLNVGLCDKHGQICTKIYKGDADEPCFDEMTDLRNEESEGGDLKYGILVYKDKKVIVFFDLLKKKEICRFTDVNFDKPFWPMFGVFRRSSSPPDVRMKLVTGRDIDMSSEKKDMLLDALSRFTYIHMPNYLS